MWKRLYQKVNFRHRRSHSSSSKVWSGFRLCHRRSWSLHLRSEHLGRECVKHVQINLEDIFVFSSPRSVQQLQIGSFRSQLLKFFDNKKTLKSEVPSKWWWRKILALKALKNSRGNQIRQTECLGELVQSFVHEINVQSLLF